MHALNKQLISQNKPVIRKVEFCSKSRPEKKPEKETAVAFQKLKEFPKRDFFVLNSNTVNSSTITMPRVQVNFGVRCKLTDNYGTIKSIVLKNETDEHNTTPNKKTGKIKVFYILWEGYNVPVPHTRRDFTMDHTILNSLKIKAKLLVNCSLRKKRSF